MSFILTAIVFLIVFGLLVLVHEWGHFYAARRAGIKVEEFGFGLPPRLWGVKRGGTMYSLNWIPFGGFVRLYGEDNYDPKVINHPHSFIGKPIGQRTVVILAGVAMNFVLAILLLTIGFSVGMVPFPGSPEFAGTVKVEAVQVNRVLPGSAAEGKLQAGDEIVAIAGRKIEAVSAVIAITSSSPGKTLDFIVRRAGEEQKVVLVPNVDGKVGVEITERISVVPLQLWPHEALVVSLKETWRLSSFTLQALGDFVRTLLYRGSIPENVAGPVGIVEMTHSIVQLGGVIPLLKFTALLSISLGVINVMPFPALDGGRFLFILVELIRRKRANAKMESLVHLVGFALLILLLVAITWNDVVRLATS